MVPPAANVQNLHFIQYARDKVRVLQTVRLLTLPVLVICGHRIVILLFDVASTLPIPILTPADELALSTDAQAMLIAHSNDVELFLEAHGMVDEEFILLAVQQIPLAKLALVVDSPYVGACLAFWRYLIEIAERRLVGN